MTAKACPRGTRKVGNKCVRPVYMREYTIKGNYEITVQATNKTDAEIYAQQLIAIDRNHYSIKHLKPKLSLMPKSTKVGKITKWKQML